MFETLSHLALQQYWWLIISALGAALVLLMFVQGGQTLFATLSKNKEERSMLVNIMGRKWEFTFTTLVVFGGAFFASFPLFYSTSFGGAYWAWMILLFAFIIQAVSYEYRSWPDNFLGSRTYETFLFINGMIGTFLVGVVVASFFTGSPFSINDMNQSFWQSPLRGIELLFNLLDQLDDLAIGRRDRELSVPRTRRSGQQWRPTGAANRCGSPVRSRPGRLLAGRPGRVRDHFVGPDQHHGPAAARCLARGQRGRVAGGGAACGAMRLLLVFCKGLA